MALPITGIGIEYSVKGLEVLGQAVKTTDDLLASTNGLITSVKSLNDALLSVNPNLATATAGMKEYTLATAGAAKASADAAAASRANARAIEAAGAAYAKAAASVAAYQAAVSASLATTVGAGFAAGAAGGMAAAGAASAVASGGSRAASLATAAGVNAIGSVTPLALTGSAPGSVAAARAGFSTLPPVTGYAYRMPPGGGGGHGYGGGNGPNSPIGGGPGAPGGGGPGIPPAMSSASGPNYFGRAANGIGAAAWSGIKHAALPAAEAGLGFAGDAIYESGKLQSLLLSTQNITGVSDAQIARARAADFKIGQATGMSPVQTAEMFREIARNSQGSMSFDQMQSMLPEMAKMQVVLGNVRGMTPESVTDTFMAMTHLFRHYDPAGSKKMFDVGLRMAELMPTDPARALNQLTYFEGTLKNLKVPDETAAALMIALSRFGLGRNKGGASIQNLFADSLGPLQMTAHAQKGKELLLGPSMLNVLDSKGNSRFFTDKSSDPMGFINALEKFAKKNGTIEAQKVFEGAFGKVGSRFGDLLADPIIEQQLANITNAVEHQKSLSLDSQAGTIFTTQNQGFKNFKSDFQGFATELGSISVPGVTRALHDMNMGLNSATTFLQQHGAMEKKIQNDILGGVKATENWVSTHKSTFVALEHDLAMAYNAGVKLAPQLLTVADGFSTLVLDINHVIDAIGSVGTFLMGDSLMAKAIRSADPDLQISKLDYDRKKNTIDPSRLGSAPLGLNIPLPARGGPTVVNLHQHFNGPTHPRAVGAAAAAGVRAAMNNSGNQVTHSGLPAALTVGGK